MINVTLSYVLYRLPEILTPFVVVIGRLKP